MEQKKILRVIIIDDAPERAEELMNWLRRGEYHIRPRFIPQSEELAELLHSHVWDILFAAGKRWLAEVAQCAAVIKDFAPDMLLIAVDDMDKSATPDEIDAAFRAGVADVVPRRENRLMHAVNRNFQLLYDRRSRRAMRLALNSTEARCRHLILAAPVAIACVTANGHIITNAAWLRLFGYARVKDLVEIKLEDLIVPDDRAQLQAAINNLNTAAPTRSIELTGIRADKSTVKLQLEIVSAFQENMPCQQVTAREKTTDAEIAQVEAPETYTHAPAADAQPAAMEEPEPAKTSAPAPVAMEGPESFVAAVAECIAAAANGREQSALLYVEIVRWKQLQTAVGESLRYVTSDLERLIESQVGHRYSLAIIEGHALAILLSKTDISAAKEYADRLQQKIDDHIFNVNDRTMRITTQMGIVRITDLYAAYPEVLEDARQACRTGLISEHRVEVFGETFSETQRSLSEVGLESFIDRAIAENRLSLVYQPLLGLHESPPVMYEAFLRMRDETGVNVPVSALFATARVQGATSSLDHWIVDQAISVLSDPTTPPTLRLFIKLESESVKSESLLLVLARLLRERHVAANRLVIEISEIIISHDPAHAHAFLSILRKLGCGVAVEHFGIGLNAQEMLKDLSVDFVKIDAMLIANMTHEPENAAVQAIVKQANSRGIATIAEWVKDAATIMAVVNAGIDYAQGAYVQPPLPALDFDFTSYS